MIELTFGPAYDPQAWESFAVAEVGAAAALAGLLVVATSININRIVQLPQVVSRLGGTLAMLTGVLLVGSLLLVPGQTHIVVGIEIAAVGLAVAAIIFRLRGLKGLDAEYRRLTLRALTVGLTAAGFIAVSGIACATGAIGGLYWIVPGSALAFIFGLANAWVALVEILR
jgi:hypothetical protein